MKLAIAVVALLSLCVTQAHAQGAPSCADDPFPDNNEPSAAAVLPSSVTAGLVCPGSDDWFIITLCAGCTLDVRVAFDGMDGDIDAVLYAADGMPAEAATSETDNEVISFTSSSTSTDTQHLLHIYIYNTPAFWSASPTPAGEPVRYNLQAAVTAPTTAPASTTATVTDSLVSSWFPCFDDAYEPNPQSSPYDLGSDPIHVSAEACPEDDDWYLFTLCQGCNLIATLTFEGYADSPSPALFHSSSTQFSSVDDLVYTASYTAPTDGAPAPVRIQIMHNRYIPIDYVLQLQVELPSNTTASATTTTSTTSTSTSTEFTGSITPYPGQASGWIRFGRSEYNVFDNDKMRHPQALAHCESLGGHLASVASLREHTWLTGFAITRTANNEVWIGGIFPRPGDLHWADGSPLSDFDLPWKEGEPSLSARSGCLMLNLRNSNSEVTGLWEAARCNRFRSYICQRPAEETTTTTTATTATTTSTTTITTSTTATTTISVGVWTAYNGSEYRLFDRRLVTFDAAEAVCQANGGHLASVDSSMQYAWLTDFARNKTAEATVWLGGRFELVWADGRVLPDFAYPWRPNDGSGGRVERCLYMVLRHLFAMPQWDDGPCNVKRAFVCRRPATDLE